MPTTAPSTLHPCLTCRTDTAYASLPVLAHEPWWFQCLCAACLDRTRPRFIPNLTPEQKKVKAKEAYRRSYDKDPELWKARAKTWQRANPERQAELASQWKLENPARMKSLSAASNANRTAFSYGREGRLTADDLETLLEEQMYRCSICRKEIENTYEVDHWEPFARGGSNHLENVHLLCPGCNKSKGSSDPYLWCRKKCLPIPRKFFTLPTP